MVKRKTEEHPAHETFETLTSVLVGERQHLSKARGPEAQLTLRNAYIAFRAGHATRQQAELIITDLAKASGYYNTTPASEPDHVLRFYEGQRDLFGRMLRFMNPTMRELEALQKAVAEEMQTDVSTAQEIS